MIEYDYIVCYFGVISMNKFKSKREEFNYYVLKSEWYKRNGDEVNSAICFKKAKQIKEEIEKNSINKK